MPVSFVPWEFSGGDLSYGCMTDEEFRAWFGGRIRAAREERGLSRPELARMLPGSIESTTLRVWEAGKVYPRAANVAAILTALDLSPEVVFGA